MAFAPLFPAAQGCYSPTLGKLQPGARLNLEVDQIARYVERLALPYRS